MSAIVVNRIKLRVPVEELATVVEHEVMIVLRGQPGFERYSLVQVGPNDMVIVISWSSVEAAGAAAAILGPGVFNTFIAPVAESQGRVVGTVMLDIRASRSTSATRTASRSARDSASGPGERSACTTSPRSRRSEGEATAQP